MQLSDVSNFFCNLFSNKNGVPPANKGWCYTNPLFEEISSPPSPMTRFCNRFRRKPKNDYWVVEERSLEARSHELKKALVGCGLSLKSAKRLAFKVFLHNPKFDLSDSSYRHILFAINQLRQEFLAAIALLESSQGEEAAQEWLCAIARGESFFCPSFWD